MNNLFKKLFSKQKEAAPCKALLELDAIRQRNEKRMAAIKESMGELYILHPSHKKSRLEIARPV